jgi:hypothetical protein
MDEAFILMLGAGGTGGASGGDIFRQKMRG